MVSLNQSSCKSSQDALWIAEALSNQISQSQVTLDHRSLFSLTFNRKAARRIELLDAVREEYLALSRELLKAERAGGVHEKEIT